MKTIFSLLDELVPASADKNLVSRSDYQKEMLEQYKQLPVPHIKSKSWGKILKNSIDNPSFHLAPKPAAGNINVNGNGKFIGGKISINENSVDVWLDENLKEQGVILCGLAYAVENYPQLVQKICDEDDNVKRDKVAVFTAGLSQHGFLIHVPNGIVIEKPIEIFVSINSGNTVLPITAMVNLEERASASLILRMTSISNQEDNAGIILMNQMMRIGVSADLCLMEVQKTGKRNWNFIYEIIHLSEQAQLEHFLLDNGGEINRRNLAAVLKGEGSQATVTGIYTPNTAQQFVYDTHQNHLASKTTSDLLFCGVLRENAYSLWRGNIYVAEGTKGADGFQINNNLLMNEDAHAESIPGLEIIADDVRCSHAVTLSSVDPDQIFYLQSRGIEPENAQELIVSGFLEAASVRVKDQKLLKLIQKELN